MSFCCMGLRGYLPPLLPPLFDTYFLGHIPTYGAHRNPGPRTMKWQPQIRQDSA